MSDTLDLAFGKIRVIIPSENTRQWWEKLKRMMEIYLEDQEIKEDVQ